MNRSWAFWAVVVSIWMFMSGMIAGIAAVSFFMPDCPTEDSCTADYHDGRWHITEVTP